MSLSSGVGARTALSMRSLYSSSSHSLCKVERGSFKVTGIEILLRSFPMFLHSKFHRFTPSVSVLGTGSCRLEFKIILRNGKRKELPTCARSGSAASPGPSPRLETGRLPRTSSRPPQSQSRGLSRRCKKECRYNYKTKNTLTITNLLPSLLLLLFLTVHLASSVLPGIEELCKTR